MKPSLTLTRWHKVAERINAAIKEREARLLADLTATSMSPWNKEGVEAKAAEIASRSKADLALVEIGTAAVARIRTALALRNAALGIADRLAEAEAVNRRARLYRSVLEKQNADMVRPADMKNIPATLPAEDSYWGRRGAASVTLAIADSALLDELRKRLAREQARSHALLDDVADINREKLDLELADELKEIAGLAA
jgi:hypothetical protein